VLVQARPPLLHFSDSRRVPKKRRELHTPASAGFSQKTTPLLRLKFPTAR
jgi:hypothetical protein